MERIEHGERITEYVVEAFMNDEWVELVNGSAVRHKKIDRFGKVRTDRLRLRATKFADYPLIRSFSAYYSAGGEGVHE
jgi:alpha-L-fucosidase